MIRAVLQDGVIVPLDPIPAEWLNGDLDLVVSPIGALSNRNGAHAASGSDSAEVDTWSRELNLIGVTEYEPGEREAIDRALEAADIQAKQEVHRQMGLP